MEVLSKHRGRLVRARGDWQGQEGTEATIGTRGTDKGKKGQRPHASADMGKREQRPHASADKGKRRPDARPTKIGILRKCTRTQRNTLLISHSPFNVGNASLFVPAWLPSCMRFVRNKANICSVYNFLSGNTGRNTLGFG